MAEGLACVCGTGGASKLMRGLNGGWRLGGWRTARAAGWLDDLRYELRRSRPEVVVRLPLVKGESNGEE